MEELSKVQSSRHGVESQRIRKLLKPHFLKELEPMVLQLWALTKEEVDPKSLISLPTTDIDSENEFDMEEGNR